MSLVGVAEQTCVWLCRIINVKQVKRPLIARYAKYESSMLLQQD